MRTLSLLCTILLCICVSMSLGISPILQEGCSSVHPHFPKENSLHKMSICTMINNEARYIQEWIEYHHVILKVDHFFIYDDGSTDNITQVLKPYVDQGIVSLFYWHNNRTVSDDLVYKDPVYTLNQRYCIADCIYNHQHETEWIGVWDVDEFLYVNDEYSSFPDVITRYLNPLKLDCLQVPLTVLGPSHHHNRPDGLVLENYHWRSNTTMFGYDSQTEKFIGKSMYRSGCGRAEVHFSPKLPANCNQERSWPDLKTNPDFPVHFKHYFSKSWQDFEEKMDKWGWKANLEGFSSLMEKYYDVYDEDMDQYIPLVKHAIECTNNELLH